MAADTVGVLRADPERQARELAGGRADLLLSWAGSLSGYLAALDRLEPCAERARLVVPGHGSPCDGPTRSRG